ncbi:ATP-binding protein [Kitasatospora sp. NPDC091207]|uniref:ATP-binding protein n=1 Tax=Kitasatospora sp. NPDC091207 TaxID=3364083 RepID=UPI00381ADC53
MLLPLLRPVDSDPAVEFRLDLFPPALPEIVGALRRLLRDTLRSLRLDPEAPCLILSELVTNALLHGDGPPTVVLELRCGRLYIAVSDASAAPVVRPAPDDSRTSGRGLDLVGALADEWGVKPIGPYGKAVWATITVGG